MVESQVDRTKVHKKPKTESEPEDSLKFLYKKEYWYISAFINTERVDINQKIEELLPEILDKTRNLTKDDLKKISYNPQWQEQVIELGKNMVIKCEWLVHIKHFPYRHENTQLDFDQLGSLQFEVEYYPDDDEKKSTIDPKLLQQIPGIILDIIEDFSNKTRNEDLFIDVESPLYIFATSNKTSADEEIDWSEELIGQHRRVIGYWTEIYSGTWADYSDTLFVNRCKNNLSNRLSELHFIRRNSGFVYMKEENFRFFFKSYMLGNVLQLTAQIRAMLFALRSIDESLDILSLEQRSERAFKKEQKYEIKFQKLDKIKQLRELLLEQMGSIHKELNTNPRQHKRAVLQHLLDQFHLDESYKRISEKFDSIHSFLQHLSIQHQQKLKDAMDRLNILIIAGVLADVAGFLIGVFLGNSTFAVQVNVISFAAMLGFLGYVVYSYVKVKSQEEKSEALQAVDAVILDKTRQNVLVIKRGNRPFKGKYALPGGYIRKDEEPIKAIQRKIEEETGLTRVQIAHVIDVFKWDKESKIESIAYFCTIDYDKAEVHLQPSGNAIEAKFMPINELKDYNLAFDHEDMLVKAGIFENL